MKVKAYEGVMKKSEILKSFLTQKMNELVSQELELAYLKKSSIITNNNDNEFKKNAEATMVTNNNLKKLGTVIRTMEELLEQYLEEEKPEKKEVIHGAR